MINNAGAGPTVTLPAGNYANNYAVGSNANSKSSTAMGQPVQSQVYLGHQKTKSTSSAVNQSNPLLSSNGAPV